VSAANKFEDIAKQTSQVLTLNLSASGTFVQQNQTGRHGEAPSHNIRRPNTTPYAIPGISVSLAKIPEEQVMRSRVEYEKR
jgi:FAD synthase